MKKRKGRLSGIVPVYGELKMRAECTHVGKLTFRQRLAYDTVLRYCPEILPDDARVWRAGAPWYADCFGMIRYLFILASDDVLTRKDNHERAQRPITLPRCR